MKQIVMIGTRFDTKGGVASVVNVYRAAGLFERFSVRYLATHCDGGAAAKIAVMLRAWFSFMLLLLTFRLGLLHIHVASRASFWRKSFFLLPCFLFRVPTILHLHGAEFAIFYEKESGALAQRYIRFVFNSVSRVVVLSSAWRTWVQGISSNPHITAIYNPVILPPQATPWRARKLGEVLFLGRLGKRKGAYDLLDATSKIASAQPQVRLLLGGDGELEQVKARAQELGLANHLQLLGWVGPQDKERYLAQAMLYILPSYNEGLPMSVLEAMAAGLPILSTPIGGIPEAVTDGVEGFLVQPGDVNALADRLQRLLSDPELASQMGAAARRKVETTFSSDAILPKVEALYRELGFGA